MKIDNNTLTINDIYQFEIQDKCELIFFAWKWCDGLIDDLTDGVLQIRKAVINFFNIPQIKS